MRAAHCEIVPVIRNYVKLHKTSLLIAFVKSWRTHEISSDIKIRPGARQVTEVTARTSGTHHIGAAAREGGLE